MAFFLATALLATVAASAYATNAIKTQPNFVFIITDDQDLELDSLHYQPAVQEHFVTQGTTFASHYCTISICCPSRVSLLTGRAAHNTNVTDVSAPYGGYTKFISEGWNDKYLPVWLQKAGYNTYYTGKIMNGYSTSTYNRPYPNGWTDRDFFLDPNTYIYNNVTMQRYDDAPRSYPGNYSTDIVAERSVEYLDIAIAAGKPFFLGVAPIGPHSQTINGKFNPAVPADRHKDLYPGLKVPRTTSFNPDGPSGASWIKTLEQLNDTVVDYLDEFYRLRILALLAVDDMVDTIIKRLELSPEVLANTYLIYTSDNGYHIGQHRLAPGKTCAIEEDIHIPFLIRGPRVGKNQTVSIPTSHTDVVPTLFRLAGIPLQDEFDGEPMPVTTEQLSKPFKKSESVNVEFWGTAILEGAYPGSGSGLDGSRGLTNTWKSVRIIGDDYSLSYVVWCTNEHELYDMTNDPVQMKNLYGTNGVVNGWRIPELTTRIDTLLLTLKACKGQVCTRPWETLHPQGNVNSLRDAMDSKFDHFYATQQPKVSYTACKNGYLAAFEGAMAPAVYAGHQELRAVRWEDWT